MPYLKPERPEKVTAPSLKASKERGERLVCLTAYDYPTARIVDEAGIDIILVGDSLGNVVLGYGNTVPVTLDEILIHVKAVRRGVQRALPGMAERRVPEIVGERQSLGQILIHAERARHGPGDLRDLEAVGQPCSVVIALVIDEDLGLVGEPAEGRRMQDAVAVALVERARGARWLGHKAPPALALVHGVRRQARWVSPEAGGFRLSGGTRLPFAAMVD